MVKNLNNLLENEIDPAFSQRAKLIFQEVTKIKPKKVLDAGCGRGFYINAFPSFKFIEEIHGIDLNENYLMLAKKNCLDKRVNIKRANINSLPYPDQYFDLIICSEILEHLKDDKKAIRELKRVLKDNGSLIITVPNYNFPFLWDPINWVLMKLFNTHVNKNIWWLAGIWADHNRLYTEKQIKKLVTDNGLKIRKLQLILHWCWPFSHFLLYGIGKNLVERFGFNNFNRFNIKSDKKISKLIAYIFSLPSRLLDKEIQSYSSMNIAIITKKFNK